MEKVLCERHGTVCLLKTGVKEGPNKGRSFYVCTAASCGFAPAAEVPPSHCLHHEDALVELQALLLSETHNNHRLLFRCVTGKQAGEKWCGSVPWTTEKDAEKRPLLDKKDQVSNMPPVRNPFKAPSKMDKTSEWRKLEDSARGETLKSHEKRREDAHGTKAGTPGAAGDWESGHGLNREETASEPSESWRSKKLPPGMKIKARASGEEQSWKEKGTENGSKSEKPRGQDKEERKETKSAAPKNPEALGENTAHTNAEQRPGPQSGKSGSARPVVDVSASKTAHRTEWSERQEKNTAQALFGDWSGSDGDEDDDDDDDGDDDVQLVSVQPAPQLTSPAALVQTTLTSYPGFHAASQVKGQEEDPRALHNQLSTQLKQKKATLSAVNVSVLPDKGERLKSQVKQLEEALESLSLTPDQLTESRDADRDTWRRPTPKETNPFSPAGCATTPAGLPLSQGSSHTSSGNPSPSPSQEGPYSCFSGVNNLFVSVPCAVAAMSQIQAFYGGRMTEDRLLAVRNATTEAIDHLHQSLESCPSPDTEAADPRGLKVQLLPHQRSALAWLLWRETQKPCGGMLADDMGLGKTLTMIALILDQKKKGEKNPELEGWISKTDSPTVASRGTLIICPASLVHHWKKEIEKHVKGNRLSVYLYHGPNRQRSTSVLAEHDVVVTTYSLVSKEVPVEKEDAGKAGELSPLLRVVWARVVLDEAHNIKNPKVQTSMAVCKLRARARWAVTGTPIQNNLLDMYSLLKFLRCSPFDEYKLWKAQVDNGSKRGAERLNILTRSLLLRRTKDQQDSTGKPLVSLPGRLCRVHRVKLSEDEQSVYDVLFAQSRSTLQNYLRRQEGTDRPVGDGSNPFEKVAREFGIEQQGARPGASSTIHILSLLLRLRQCCCHLSLLKKTLDPSELQGDGVALSLEEQLCALSLSDTADSDTKATVSLNGNVFRADLFEESRQSTKISAILIEMQEILCVVSVIVSQWTSMLHIVAVHLKKMGLHFGVIDGTVNPKRRMDLVEDFNTNPKGPQVMLVSLCAGGVGINLTGGNHLFLIDMHWNPALEDQACDRIYRVGQHRDVTIHKFTCEGTVEDKISSLQEKKKELAQKVLSGTGSSFTKLSLADLRVIFGV
ncbi:transcription termination factor 2 isoform X3 [Electrophorus electricus]|uniref:transcription termination factor 2 isoform X3 n=2 Tax=Electrophorus electricus TaxID=8005 RepID=UPI0015CFE3D0|nr:transcription termination factor 2 isoform X3 [Electrophorus electricus]